MVRMFLRGGGRREGVRDAARVLAERVRELLSLGEDASVSVSEIACGDPACGGAETVILVMRPGQRTQAAKLLQPLGTVTDAELVEGLRPLAAPGGPAA